jgi:hypothetical protein
MRTLLYVPTLHTDGEMGRPASEAGHDPRFEERENLILKQWDDVTENTTAWILANGVKSFYYFCEGWTIPNFEKVHANQDYFFEKDVRGMKSFGATLLELGAELHVTENFIAYKIGDVAERARGFVTGFLPEDYEPQWEPLIVRPRDRCIARKLSDTVPDNATAVLCMGLAHDVPAYLDSSWKVQVMTTKMLHHIALVMLGNKRRWTQLFQTT